jgi:hypothetical protein
MAYDRHQFEALITRTLTEIGLYSPEAVQLLLGTAAKESGFGTYLRQLGKGPALGAFQIEPFTFTDILGRFRSRLPAYYIGSVPAQCEWNLRLSIMIARLKYFSCPGPIPKTTQGQAEYWDKYYNCNPDYGTVEEYLQAYRKYVGDPI